MNRGDKAGHLIHHWSVTEINIVGIELLRKRIASCIEKQQNDIAKISFDAFIRNQLKL